GMDYRKLRDYLAQGKWKEADEETRRVMLAVAKRDNVGWLDVEDIDNFPCEDLRTIDQLWVKYSDGKFGFSVQKRIYQSLGGTREYNTEIWEKFGDKVGWRKGEKERVESRGIWEKLRDTWSDVWSQPVGSWLYYQNITFDKKAPEGHLPAGVGGMERILGYYYTTIKETDVGWGGGVGYFGRVLKGRGVSLFSRVETCRL
ncbi:MAG: GUN4 domain-containing protein, partial [Aphanizomenon gracile PMC644.10]|nr:GUN4 domain-containing protein [Aphanizomenon gracile PMC644.10]